MWIPLKNQKWQLKQFYQMGVFEKIGLDSAEKEIIIG
jgi:hypothetical protein